jgi:hypothetical protein
VPPVILLCRSSCWSEQPWSAQQLPFRPASCGGEAHCTHISGYKHEPHHGEWGLVFRTQEALGEGGSKLVVDEGGGGRACDLLYASVLVLSDLPLEGGRLTALTHLDASMNHSTVSGVFFVAWPERGCG